MTDIIIPLIIAGVIIIGAIVAIIYIRSLIRPITRIVNILKILY